MNFKAASILLFVNIMLHLNGMEQPQFYNITDGQRYIRISNFWGNESKPLQALSRFQSANMRVDFPIACIEKVKPLMQLLQNQKMISLTNKFDQQQQFNAFLSQETINNLNSILTAADFFELTYIITLLVQPYALILIRSNFDNREEIQAFEESYPDFFKLVAQEVVSQGPFNYLMFESIQPKALPTPNFNARKRLICFALSNDQQVVAIGTDKEVLLLTTKDFDLLKHLTKAQTNFKNIRIIALNSDATKLVIGDGYSNICVLDISNKEE